MSQFQTDRQMELLTMLKAGRLEAFETLYDIYAPLLYGIILRIVKNERHAQEILQECFVGIQQQVQHFDPSRMRLGIWLSSLARQTALKFVRLKNVNEYAENHGFQNLVFAEAGNLDNTADFLPLLDKLTPKCREIMDLIYFSGYGRQEVADKLGIPAEDVRSCVQSAVRELRIFVNTGD